MNHGVTEGHSLLLIPELSLFFESTKDSLRSNSPVEMETSTEPMDPLTPSVAALAAQPEGACREAWAHGRVTWLLCQTRPDSQAQGPVEPRK